MSYNLGQCDCPHCGYFFFNEYEIPFCPRCEKQLSFYRSPYGKDPVVFAAEEAQRKKNEDIKYSNITSILSAMPHKNPLSKTEYLALITIFFAINPPNSDSSFTINKYTKLDAILFTASIIRASCISNAASKQQAQSISNEYISLITKACKSLFSMDEPDYTSFLSNRWTMYDNVFMNNAGDINMLCDILTNALILDKDNEYNKLDIEETYINSIFDSFSVKTEVSSYINSYSSLFIQFVKDALEEHYFPDNTNIHKQQSNIKNQSSTVKILIVIAFCIIALGIAILLSS